MKPRPIIPGTTYLITRRTTQRQYLLRPSRQVNACIRYCLALAQRRSGVKIHCVVFMSNHYHLVVTDLLGQLPVFTEELNKLLARSLNCHRGRWENFWAASTQTSQVTLASEQEVLEKTVYSLANPTKALLVKYGSEWPGVRLFCAGSYVAKKPPFFFRKTEDGGVLPDKADLVLTAPPIGVSARRADSVVKAAVSVQEGEIRSEAKRKKKRFKGAAAVKAQDVFGTPSTAAPRRGMSPRLASREKDQRIAALTAMDDFTTEYRERRKEFVGGKRDVVFPHGTYLLVVQHGACCAEA